MLFQDVRYGLRLLTRAPAFTGVVLLSLAVGAGATTAAFSLVHALFFRELPVRNPEQLVEFLSHYPGDPRMNQFDWTAYEHYRANTKTLTEIIAAAPVPVEVGASSKEAVVIEAVAGDYFAALGARPAIGRLLEASDDRLDGQSSVAVLSWAYWRTRLAANPSAIGTSIVVNGLPVTVVGVADREFRGLQPGRAPAFWVPAAFASLATRTTGRPRVPFLQLAGRLAPGVSLAQARAELRALDRTRLERLVAGGTDPTWLQVRLDLEPAGAGFNAIRDQLGTPLWVLTAVVSVLLLIACLNIATMLAARAAARHHEMAVRAAIGAGRTRLVRQLFTESMLLSIAGVALGTLFASATARALLRALPIDPRSRIRLDEIPLGIDGAMLLFASGVTVAATVLFGLAPAWQAMSSGSPAALRHGAGQSASKGRRIYERSLVVLQVAFGVVLASTALLLVGHLMRLRGEGAGFDRRSVLLMSVDPRRSGQSPDELLRMYQSLLERTRSLPGVHSAALAALTPTQPGAASRFLVVPGFEEPLETRRRVSLNWVGPQYFETVRTPLLAGRDFAETDEGRAPVAIVNQRLARQYLPNANPIGRRFNLEREPEPYEIVGVATDAKYNSLQEPAPPTVYLHALQGARGRVSQFAIRTIGNPLAVAPWVRSAVRDTSAALEIGRITTLSQQVDASIVPERLTATLTVALGSIGVVLATIGLYGLLAFSVALRTREIGIRVVLGATPRQVLHMVLAGAAWLLVAGAAIGVPLAFWMVRVSTSIVPGLEVGPVVPIAAGLACLILACLAGAWLPARYAARIHPIEALRHL